MRTDETSGARLPAELQRLLQILNGVLSRVADGPLSRAAETEAVLTDCVHGLDRAVRLLRGASPRVRADATPLLTAMQRTTGQLTTSILAAEALTQGWLVRRSARLNGYDAAGKAVDGCTHRFTASSEG